MNDTTPNIKEFATATKPPKSSGKRAKATASTVHDGANAELLSQCQSTIAETDQAIIARAIADRKLRNQALYYSAYIAEGKNFVQMIESSTSAQLAGRAAQKTAHVLQPAQTAQLQLTGSADAAHQEVKVYSVDEFLDGLEDDE